MPAGHARISRLAAGLSLLVVTSGCGEHVRGYDARLFQFLNGQPPIKWLDDVMLVVSDPRSVVLLLPLIAWYGRDIASGWRRPVVAGILALVLLAAVDGSATMLKQHFGRARPCWVVSGVRAVAPCSGSPSLPSNHAANVFALTAFGAAIVRRRAAPWFGLAALVGYSRVHLGVHYPLDVLAGAAWGGAFGWVAGVSSRRLVRSER